MFPDKDSSNLDLTTDFSKIYSLRAQLIGGEVLEFRNVEGARVPEPFFELVVSCVYLFKTRPNFPKPC